jgi:hypothetical protein
MGGNRQRSIYLILAVSLFGALWPSSCVPPPSETGREEKFKKFTVCIGDICRPNVPGSADYNYGCGFAEGNPTNTDDAAAKDVCEFRNNFPQYSFVRYNSVNGGRCGAIYVNVKCCDMDIKCESTRARAY